ncbi:iron-containing alcohol dehydrogenase [Microvirga massiliensis]|uniref:iron-containing alcohol dehydrogenase n=1 Tax=Microvirga massiliensis TaxID=1033741 RepID=UPI00062BDE9C|nr:iron-containing alcohol dehydrogenase [Microvirga massiliensis]
MGLITYLTTIRFEAGAARDIGSDLTTLKIDRPLVVTDAGIVAAGLVDRLASGAPALKSAPVFSDVPTNPTEEAALAALEIYREQGCGGVVAIGGGSPIDLAKAVALLATHDGPLEAYAAILGGISKIGPAVAPAIAVPTTAGTGSEVGRAALITLRDGRKLGFISPHLIPKLAVCDPELTYGLPPGLTAATGMDALTHCIETFLSPRDNPPAEAIALDGLARAGKSLEKAVANGSNVEARQEMMMAALEGGLTFQKGLGAVHSLSHALGGLKELKLHHGTLNAVLLPAVLRFNEPVAGEKYAALRRVMGLSPEQDLASFIEDLNQRLGLPKSLREMGVPKDVFPAMAKAAMADHSTATNPRPATEDDFAALLTAAY